MISIVIPVYNSARYLRECMDSIMNQTFQDFEVIVVDDGSTDNTVEIVQSYKDPRIKLICNEHNYIQSLNIGMTAAKGKYIARMDSDDIMLPERLQLQYDFMEEYPEIDVCGGFAQCFGDSTREIKLATSHADIVSGLILHNTMAHPTVMIRQSVVTLFPKVNKVYQCYNADYLYAEDYKLWTELAIMGYRFANITDIILKYRISENQVTSHKYEEMMKCSYRISVEYMEKIGEMIVNKNEVYETILEETIRLFNKETINYNSLKIIFNQIYKNFLICQTES